MLWVCVWAPLKVFVHVWALQQRHAWIRVRKCGVRVCSSPQLFTSVFIWGGQALTRHTNTHPPLSGLCHSLLRPGPVILTSPHIWILLLPFSAPAFHPAQHQKYTQPYTVITLKIMKTFQLPKWDSSEVHEECEALSSLWPTFREFEWNIKIYVLLHQHKDDS